MLEYLSDFNELVLVFILKPVVFISYIESDWLFKDYSTYSKMISLEFRIRDYVMGAQIYRWLCLSSRLCVILLVHTLSRADV